MSLRKLLAPLCALVIAFAGCGSPSNTTPGGGTTGGGGSETGGGGDLKRLVILTNGDDPFWDACEAGANVAAEELKLKDNGYMLTYERSNFTVDKQVAQLKGYRLAGDVVAVGVSVVDSASPAIARELEDLQEAGIKVVTIDGDVDRESFRNARTAYLGTDNIIAGRELGKAAAVLKEEPGHYCCFVGIKSAANAIARVDGFKEGVGEKHTFIETLADATDAAKAKLNVDNAIQKHENLDMLVGIWAYNTPSIVQVLEDKGQLDDFLVCSIDAAELTIRAMEEGKVDVMVVQNPFVMGNQGLKLLYAMVTDDQDTIKTMYPNLEDTSNPTYDIYSTGLRVVVPEGSPLIEKKDIFEEGTEFMLLPDFQAWLAQYNLKSS